MSDSLWLYESQHTRPPCQSPTPGVYSNSCPSSQWCHPAISSSVVPFSSCPQCLPASGSFPWVSSSHQVAKVLEFQLQHQSFQWTPGTDPPLGRLPVSGRLFVVVKCWRIKSYTVFSTTLGVSTPNPHIVQGPTAVQTWIFQDILDPLKSTLESHILVTSCYMTKFSFLVKTSLKRCLLVVQGILIDILVLTCWDKWMSNKVGAGNVALSLLLWVIEALIYGWMLKYVNKT